MVEKVELKEIINQIRGVSYGKNDVSDTKVDGYVPVLRSNNIQDSRIDLSDLVYVKPEKVKPVQFLKKGDILITASTGSLKVIGKNAQCKDDLNASFGAFCKVVRVKDADHSYLGHLFQSPQYFSYIQNIVNGANINNIKNEHIDNFKIPLPPLKTQQKIAQILDNAAALRDKTAQLLEEYELLVQSIFLDMFGDPVVNPMGWDEQKLGEICGIGSSKRVFVNEFVNSGVPFYRGKEIGELSEGKAISTELFISQEHYENLKSSSGIPKIGDLLLPSICPDGRILRVINNEPFYFKDGRVLWIKVNESKIDGIYLKFFLRELFKVNYSNIASGTTFAELKIIALKNINTVVPPIKLQTHFSQKIANIEAQKALARQELEESEDLFNCLLQKAFRGKLVG